MPATPSRALTASRGELGGAPAVVRRQRRSGRGRGLRQLGDVPQPLAVGPQLLLALDRDLGGVLHERPQLGEPLRCRRRAAHELVVGTPGSLELAPRRAQPRAPAELLVAAVGIENVELIRRASQPALLELARHRHEPLGGGRHVLARRRAAPGVRARAPVPEHAPGDDDVFLAVGPQLEQRQDVVLLERARRRLELGLDIRIGALGAHERGVPARAEQQPHGLREDRLPRAGLPGDRVQTRGKLELGLADEDEVLDAQPTKQRSRGSG